MPLHKNRKRFYQKQCEIAIFIHVDNITLNLDKAIPCGLIINELISNSYKHAFPEREIGEIIIEFKNDKKGNYSLTISDDGSGLPEDFDINKTETLGMQLFNFPRSRAVLIFIIKVDFYYLS